MELVWKGLKIGTAVMSAISENVMGYQFHALWGENIGYKGSKEGRWGRSVKFWVGFFSVFLHGYAERSAVINTAGWTYAISKQLQLQSRLSSVGGVSVLGLDRSHKITRRCCITVDCCGGLVDMSIGLEWLSMICHLLLWFWDFSVRIVELRALAVGVDSWH